MGFLRSDMPRAELKDGLAGISSRGGSSVRGGSGVRTPGGGYRYIRRAQRWRGRQTWSKSNFEVQKLC